MTQYPYHGTTTTTTATTTTTILQQQLLLSVCSVWQAFVVSSQAMPMTQYPYPGVDTTDTRIYRPQQPPSRYANMDDSSAPLTQQSYSTSNYPADTSSPQVSSFDTDEPAVVKVRRPKKTKNAGGPAGQSEKEKEAMMVSAGEAFCHYY